MLAIKGICSRWNGCFRRKRTLAAMQEVHLDLHHRCILEVSEVKAKTVCVLAQAKRGTQRIFALTSEIALTSDTKPAQSETPKGLLGGVTQNTPPQGFQRNLP